MTARLRGDVRHSAPAHRTGIVGGCGGRLAGANEVERPSPRIPRLDALRRILRGEGARGVGARTVTSAAPATPALSRHSACPTWRPSTSVAPACGSVRNHPRESKKSVASPEVDAVASTSNRSQAARTGLWSWGKGAPDFSKRGTAAARGSRRPTYSLRLQHAGDRRRLPGWQRAPAWAARGAAQPGASPRRRPIRQDRVCMPMALPARHSCSPRRLPRPSAPSRPS